MQVFWRGSLKWATLIGFVFQFILASTIEGHIQTARVRPEKQRVIGHYFTSIHCSNGLGES